MASGGPTWQNGALSSRINRITLETHMARYTLEEFVETTRQQDREQGLFELENERLPFQAQGQG